MSEPSVVPEQHRPSAIHALRWLSVAALGVALFAILAAWLIHAGPSVKLDVKISAFVQSARSPLLDAVMITATYLCSWQAVVSGGVLATIYLLIQRTWLAAAAMVVSLIGNVAIIGGLKTLMGRVRPDQAHALLPANGSTFPSGHTFSAFAFYGLLALIYTGQGRRVAHTRLVIASAAVTIAMVGISRVYVGAHWPSDVLGSVFLGSGWLALIGLILASAREQTTIALPQTNDRSAQRWALALVLVWAIFIVAYAYFFSPAHPSAAIA